MIVPTDPIDRISYSLAFYWWEGWLSCRENKAIDWRILDQHARQTHHIFRPAAKNIINSVNNAPATRSSRVCARKKSTSTPLQKQ